MQQEVLNGQIYQVDNYNPERHSSQFNNHPHYSYGKRHVENPASTKPQGHEGSNNYQGGRFQGGNQPYQGGRSQGFQGPNTFQRGAPNPMHAKEASTSQAPPRHGTYQAPPGFEHKRENYQAQPNDSREPTFKEIITALSASHLKTNQNVSIMSQGLSKLELQVGQLSKQFQGRQQRALPSQSEQNPRHESVKAITTLRSGRSYDNLVNYNPHAHIHAPFSSTTFMAPCLNYENLYEENGAGGEENVPSGNLESGDCVGYMRRNKGEDKEAGREENVPTGGALKGALKQACSLPVHPSGLQAVSSGRPSVSEENQKTATNPLGRQEVAPGRRSS